MVSEPLPTWVWFQNRPARSPQNRIGSAPRPKPLSLSGDLHSLRPQDPAKNLPVRMFVWLLQWTRVILGREVLFEAVVTAFGLQTMTVRRRKSGIWNQTWSRPWLSFFIVMWLWASCLCSLSLNIHSCDSNILPLPTVECDFKKNKNENDIHFLTTAYNG